MHPLIICIYEFHDEISEAYTYIYLKYSIIQYFEIFHSSAKNVVCKLTCINM